jgi:hypothetical protein
VRLAPQKGRIEALFAHHALRAYSLGDRFALLALLFAFAGFR